MSQFLTFLGKIFPAAARNIWVEQKFIVERTVNKVRASFQVEAKLNSEEMNPKDAQEPTMKSYHCCAVFNKMNRENIQLLIINSLDWRWRWIRPFVGSNVVLPLSFSGVSNHFN